MSITKTPLSDWFKYNYDLGRVLPAFEEEPTKTSESNPYRPSYIAVESGEVGLCICPAKKGHGLSGSHDRDFRLDMLELQDQGVTTLVGLMPELEMQDYEVLDLLDKDKTEEYGIEYIHFPWVDRQVPCVHDLFEATLKIYERLKDGERIVVHCRGGLGRTGVFVAGILCHAGYHIDKIINLLTDARGDMCPETQEQREFIRYMGVKQMMLNDCHDDIEDEVARMIRIKLKSSIVE